MAAMGLLDRVDFSRTQVSPPEEIDLTADGQLRTCLFSIHEHNLKGLLRSGATDEEIADFIIAAVWKKEPGHKIGQPDFVQPSRSMSAIGG